MVVAWRTMRIAASCRRSSAAAILIVGVDKAMVWDSGYNI